MINIALNIYKIKWKKLKVQLTKVPTLGELGECGKS